MQRLDLLFYQMFELYVWTNFTYNHSPDTTEIVSLIWDDHRLCLRQTFGGWRTYLTWELFICRLVLALPIRFSFIPKFNHLLCMISYLITIKDKFMLAPFNLHIYVHVASVLGLHSTCVYIREQIHALERDKTRDRSFIQSITRAGVCTPAPLAQLRVDEQLFMGSA